MIELRYVASFLLAFLGGRYIGSVLSLVCIGLSLLLIFLPFPWEALPEPEPRKDPDGEPDDA